MRTFNSRFLKFTLFTLFVTCVLLWCFTAASEQPKARGACTTSADCSGNRGRCFLRECFCRPGATGAHCEIGSLLACGSLADQLQRLQCYNHPKYGSAEVDIRTWRTAVDSEAAHWASSRGEASDRSDEHAEGFGGFSALPQDVHLGSFAEFGCGPFTQTKTCLLAHLPSARLSSITLLDPNLHNYMRDVDLCSFKSGNLVPGVTTYLVSAGAEAPLFNGAFDTLLMTNVLEHVTSAYDVLENIHTALKPGGRLIFNDRWWDAYVYERGGVRDIDNTLHPIRVKRAVIEHFLAQFTSVYRNDGGTAGMKWRSATYNISETGTYFIGTKK